ncbi:MAG: thermophilic metalloprotease superfamily [Patescibacteria group bacterium]|nr:thermophilic metalloprotease superfamily [Patescibacteria group bacterium]
MQKQLLGAYTPDQDILDKYAKVMVHYAMGGGKGLKPGETVWLSGCEYTKPLFMAVLKEIWRSGGNAITSYLPNEIGRYGLSRELIELGSDEQLGFFANKVWKGVCDEADHIMFIICEPDVHNTEGLPAEKVAKLSSVASPFMKWRQEKEAEGKQDWTLCLYGSESMAKEAGMSTEEYWDQIIKACYLKDEDPVGTWKRLQVEMSEVKQKLTDMKIQWVHIEGEDADLKIKIGSDRKWNAGSGKNIPSFEVFTSPDWRGTEGWIRFNQPLYWSGNRISGIELYFKNGVITQATATENQDALLQMIANEGANKLGEFSLTDSRHSQIEKFMAVTLYDENIGGEFGNTHIAVGMSYHDTLNGPIINVSDEEWEERGFNKCLKVHTDIISTANRKVTATLEDGSKVVIYENGKFTFL